VVVFRSGHASSEPKGLGDLFSSCVLFLIHSAGDEKKNACKQAIRLQLEFCGLNLNTVLESTWASR
jgi:hypothetical protein